MTHISKNEKYRYTNHPGNMDSRESIPGPSADRDISIPALKDRNMKQGCSGGILVWYKEGLHELIKPVKRGDCHIWIIGSSILTS